MKNILLEEKWTQWKPIKNLSTKYSIDFIIDNINNFEMLLFDTNNKKKVIKIELDGTPEAYRKIDISLRWNTINFLDEKYGYKFYKEWTFFKIQNSKYISWLSEESYITNPNLRHFAIITNKSLVDILDFHEPKIEIL